MEFCPICKRILSLKTENDKIIGLCSCGFKRTDLTQLSFTEEIRKKEQVGKEVAEDIKDLSGFPHKCRKCDHDSADVRDLGIFFGDEAGVYLFKCKKCGYTERQSDGTGN